MKLRMEFSKSYMRPTNAFVYFSFSCELAIVEISCKSMKVVY